MDLLKTTVELKTSDLVPFSNHPFRLYDGKRFDALCSSINESGVLVPIIVRPKGDKYEILSGHNRVRAAEEIGKETIPAIIRDDLSEDEARLVVVVTNIMQRSFSDLSHFERAATLNEHYNIIKSQGKRTDLIDSLATLLCDNGTSVVTRQKLNARECIAKSYGIGGTTVAQYLRVFQLVDALKERLDNEELSLRAAVELSYLSETSQNTVNDVLSNSSKKNIDVKTANQLRNIENDGLLEYSDTERIMNSNPKSTLTKTVRLSEELFSKYFTDEPDESITNVIHQALEAWFNNKKS